MTETTIEKYAIYLRKSRADIEAEKLGEGETLAKHKAILTERAAREGYYVEKIYQEIVSGETIEARPEMQKLINDCYAGKYKGILVMEISRLSRGNQGDAQIILDCLRYSNNNSGLLVITPTKKYDIAHNADDEEYMEFELFMSRREYKMIQKRLNVGREQSVVEGNYIGTHRPYGYDIVKTKAYRTLIPNEAEAPWLKKIFEWAVKENLTPHKIALRLTAMGVPTYSGKPEWDKHTVRQILQNRVYIGKVFWNKRMQVKRLVDGELVKSRRLNDDGDRYIEADGKHMKHALIDEKTFDAANARFHRDKTREGLALQNPLAGLLYCEKCGRAMGRKFNPNNPNAKARYVHKSSTACKVKSVKVSDVMDALVHALKLYIEDFELKIDNMPEIDEASIAEQIDQLEKEIRKTERKLSRLFDAWEDEEITNNEFAQRKAVHNERIENIKREIANLEIAMPAQEEYKEIVVRLSDALDALKDDDLAADIKNAFLKDIIDNITFTRENDDEFILDITLK